MGPDVRMFVLLRARLTDLLVAARPALRLGGCRSPAGSTSRRGGAARSFAATDDGPSPVSQAAPRTPRTPNTKGLVAQGEAGLSGLSAPGVPPGPLNPRLLA